MHQHLTVQVHQSSNHRFGQVWKEAAENLLQVTKQGKSSSCGENNQKAIATINDECSHLCAGTIEAVIQTAPERLHEHREPYAVGFGAAHFGG